ncbi:DUF445 domain-containing protein [Nocardioides bruguierae]|uniref:DUF445 domain-containing protein n=1 Tax=Nocardioides bruguierae TaxID=2945102 RepID=UPI0020222A2B|nr:DUF445 domain-containing protein [Nocardioides bruguierae]MCL8024843.1 DUF445 domain-containing protein [Nocardioides bruguierae]
MSTPASTPPSPSTPPSDPAGSRGPRGARALGAGLVAGEEADARRARDLRRWKLIALGLLLVAAITYAVTLPFEDHWFWGFVNAGAEASMVGAMADWFAVTALFRHPLGLPIPHTALIPRRKDDLGAGLSEFVSENFLAEDVVRDRLAAARVSERVGTWLSRPEARQRLVDEGSDLLGTALARVTDEHVRLLVEDGLVPRLRDERLAPLLGSMLTEAMRDDLHHGVVDLVLDEMHDWLLANPATVAEVVEERAPWWAPQGVNEMVSSRLHRELVRFVVDVRDTPDHRARRALDSWLAQLATDLGEDTETAAATERLKERLLDQPQVVATAVSVWDALRRALVGSLTDPDGLVRARVLEEVRLLAERLVQDADLRARLDGLAADAVVHVVGRYGHEAVGIISSTIQGWDGREAAQRIELHVGKDLQFIRLNGTVVGGLVGVVIHGLALLLG